LAIFRISEATDTHMNYNYNYNYTTKPRVVLPPNYVKGKCAIFVYLAESLELHFD